MSHVKLVRPNEANQPDPNLTRILTGIKSILDPEGPTQPESGSSWVQVGPIRLITELNLNLNPL